MQYKSNVSCAYFEASYVCPVCGEKKRKATLDLDATVIESHKREALPHYQGGRGYQPVAAAMP